MTSMTTSSSTTAIQGSSSPFLGPPATATASSPSSTRSITIAQIGGIVGGLLGGLLLAVLVLGLIRWRSKYQKPAEGGSEHDGVKRCHRQEQISTEYAGEEQVGGWPEVQEQNNNGQR